MRYYPAYIVTRGSHHFVGNYDNLADVETDYIKSVFVCWYAGDEIHIDLLWFDHH